MEHKGADPEIDASARQRKFGLPDWMVNNIERLNFVTDFEQYACSPPETESFLTDYKEGHDAPQMAEPYCPVVEPKAAFDTDIKNVIQMNIESTGQPIKLVKSSDLSPSLHPSLLNSIKNEELFSSPDNSPCATPEPSPIVRRKMSNPSDTVITNPGRWFYLGKVNKLKKNLKEQSAEVKDKENKIKCEERFPVLAGEPKNAYLDSKQNGIKLMISNFDINAVSPTSW